MAEEVHYPGTPPRLVEYFSSRPLFFVTFNTWKRQRLLDNVAVHRAFVAFGQRGVEMHRAWIGRYVLMPDHVHLFVRGDQTFDLGTWVRGIKRALDKSILRFVEQRWQPGFFDHVLRSNESYAEKWHYVEQNPVRAGLAPIPEAWPFQGEIATVLGT